MEPQFSQFTAIVVDDEPFARVHMTQLLKESGVGKVLQASGAPQCLEMFEDEPHRPDWVFLDVRMPGLDGLELADALGAGEIGESGNLEAPEVVFVTGYEDYAIQAFDRAAADYLLKPVGRDRLNLTLKRLAARRNAQTSGTISTSLCDLPVPSLKRLPIRMDYSVRLLDTADVLCAVARDKRVEVVTASDSYTTYYTLNQLEQRLPADQFVRVHDGWIVNLTYVVEIHNLGSQNYQLSLRNTDRVIPVSRRRLGLLQQRLGI